MKSIDRLDKVFKLAIIIRLTLDALLLRKLQKAFFPARIGIITFFILGAIITLPSHAFSQQRSFAKLISLIHDYGCGGSIEYALLGGSSNYTYYWKHGPKTLKITGLEPGTYTLVVRDKSGCEQEFSSTILDSDCTVEVTFSPGPTDCEIYVHVEPLTSDDPSTVFSGSVTTEISWSDGGPEAFTRLLDKEVVEAGTLSFMYSRLFDGQICCDTTGVIVPGEGWEEAPEGGCIPECEYEITIEQTHQLCQRLVTIIPDTIALESIEGPTFVIRWSDGLVTSNLQRLISVSEDNTLLHAQVTVFELYTCSEACRFNFTIAVPGVPGCRLKPEPGPEDQRLIINEFGTIADSSSSRYIELLVTGGGACGEHSDLRGIIIDDNNGDIIPAGEFVHTYNRHLIGINPGFIYFSYDEAWSEIPNGSLIVIYSERDDSDILPADDPFDTDEDHVYVLSISQPSLFRGKTSWWNEEEGLEVYEGLLDPVSWDKIMVAGSADGIQARLPSGEYMHGLSTGVSPLALPTNPFNLWLGEMSAGTAVCRLDGDSPYNWEAFQCTLYSETAVSPGLPNSEKNASLVEKLLICDEEEELPLGPEEESSAIRSVEVNKTADVSSFDSLGQIITYTITVANTGDTVLTNVIVEDVTTGLDTTILFLLPCETRTFTTTYQLNECEELQGPIRNIVDVVYYKPLRAKDTVDVASNTIELTLVKRFSESNLIVGDTVRFFLTLNNSSQNEATGVAVEDYLSNDGYSEVLNISDEGEILSSGDSLSVIGWENLIIPPQDSLVLFFDAIVAADRTYGNCAAIISTDQYNIKAEPCEGNSNSISSCVEPDFCQISASIVDIDYHDNGTPVDPSDDEVYFEILVTAPVGVTGEWDILSSSAGNFEGDFGVPEIIGPFPIGFEDEWLNITIKGDTPCEGTLLITSPAVLGDLVWYDTDLDGLKDSGEDGISGIEVVLKQNTTTIATTTTDSNGHYLFTNLEPGDYKIFISQAPATWTTVDSINFEVALLAGITQISGNSGFVLSGNGATGSSADKCVRSALLASNNYLSLQYSLSDDYEYRIRWNVKNSTTNPAFDKIIQLRHNTTATYTGTDISSPYTLPQIATTSAGSDYTSSAFWGLSGTTHLILAPASGSSSANVNCYFDNFRLQRRPNFLIPTIQNVGSDESIDSDINSSGLSGSVTLESGEIYLDMDAGFIHGIELLGGNPPQESQVIAAGIPGEDALLAYPNPFSESCRLRLGSSVAGDGVITLYSALSQHLLDIDTRLILGSNDMDLKLPANLPAGVYIVKVQFPSGKMLAQKITKIRL